MGTVHVTESIVLRSPKYPLGTFHLRNRRIEREAAAGDKEREGKKRQLEAREKRREKSVTQKKIRLRSRLGPLFALCFAQPEDAEYADVAKQCPSLEQHRGRDLTVRHRKKAGFSDSNGEEEGRGGGKIGTKHGRAVGAVR